MCIAGCDAATTWIGTLVLRRSFGCCTCIALACRGNKDSFGFCDVLHALGGASAGCLAGTVLRTAAGCFETVHTNSCSASLHTLHALGCSWPFPWAITLRMPGVSGKQAARPLLADPHACRWLVEASCMVVRVISVVFACILVCLAGRSCEACTLYFYFELRI